MPRYIKISQPRCGFEMTVPDHMFNFEIGSRKVALDLKDRTSTNVGDIIVVIVDNEFTLKRLDRARGRVVLKPENKAYPVIRPIPPYPLSLRERAGVRVSHLVVEQFRKY